MHHDGTFVDRATQAWVRATGRRVTFEECPWLDGPVGDPTVIGEAWIEPEAERRDGHISEGGGLISSVEALRCESFDPSCLAPAVAEFYEHTSSWRMEAWSQWCPAAWPVAWLISTVFARRLRQLALPLRPLDVAQGMDSQVLAVTDDDGQQLGAAWLRTLRSNGHTVYSGWYGVVRLPRAAGPSIRVTFPLPNGSLSVFLRPSTSADGALVLTSPLGAFGDDGAYLIVALGDGHAVARRIPLTETFRVFLDRDGTLRTDHALDLWRVPALRFHYRLEHQPAC